VVVDQFLLEAEPNESDQMLQHLGSAVPVYVNCAIAVWSAWCGKCVAR
jgi:hypothetical protein